MLYRSDALLNQVISELELTQEDLQMFTPPKQFHDKYVRNIIYDLSKHQMGLFLNVIQFDDNITKLKDMQKSLIMYLDHNPNYRDIHYYYIWAKFAHKYIMNGHRKVNIINYNFQTAHINQIPLSFTNNSNENTEELFSQTNKVEEVIPELTYEDEHIAPVDSDEIQYLIVQMNRFRI